MGRGNHSGVSANKRSKPHGELRVRADHLIISSYLRTPLQPNLKTSVQDISKATSTYVTIMFESPFESSECEPASGMASLAVKVGHGGPLT